MKALHVMIVSLISASTLFASQTYNLDELIELSFKNSPELQVSKKEIAISQNNYKIASAAYLPKVDMLASAGLLGQKGGLSSETDTDKLLRGSITAQQLVYDFGKTTGNIAVQDENLKAQRMQDLQQISNKIKDVKLAYYNLLKADALINVQQENIKLNEAQLYRSQKYFQAGIRTKIDISDAKVSLTKAKIELNKAKYQKQNRYAVLDKTIGSINTTREYEVNCEKLELNTLATSLHAYEFSLSDAITYAYEHKPELKSLKHTIEASKQSIKSVNGEYFPSIYLYADYTKQELNSLKDILPSDSWQASANLSWNFYEGGSTSARKQINILQNSKANLQLTFAKLVVKQEITQAYINYEEQKDQVELADSLMRFSAQKYDQASKRYENGLSDYIELQQARQEYIDAKANLVITYFDYYVAIAQLDHSIGK